MGDLRDDLAAALHQSDCAIASLHPQPCTEGGTLTDYRRADAVLAVLAGREVAAEAAGEHRHEESETDGRCVCGDQWPCAEWGRQMGEAQALREFPAVVAERDAAVAAVARAQAHIADEQRKKDCYGLPGTKALPLMVRADSILAALDGAGDEPRGYCTCYGRTEPARDCGIPEHRATARAAYAPAGDEPRRIMDETIAYVFENGPLPEPRCPTCGSTKWSGGQHAAWCPERSL